MYNNTILCTVYKPLVQFYAVYFSLYVSVYGCALDRERQTKHVLEECILTFSCEVGVPPAVQVELDQESKYGEDHNNTFQHMLI